MFLLSNQAKALLLASYYTGKVMMEKIVVAAKSTIPINNKLGKVFIMKIPPIKIHCT
jgi:hypothetical protein